MRELTANERAQLRVTARLRQARLADVPVQIEARVICPDGIGDPEQLADHMIAWQDAGAVDGFTFMGSTLPHELTAFVEHVVPILQRRGRFRTEYTGQTLRNHLGLARPEGSGTGSPRRQSA